MIAKYMNKILAVALSFILVAATSPAGYGYQAEPSTGVANEPAPKTAAELQALVSPIALYPDALLAQLLSASTFPDQVALAQNWVQQHSELTGSKLTKEVDKQSWDPAVKALTAFPTVLDNMAKNLAWTSELGEAYHFQAKDVMTAVQELRVKAQAAGNLKSSPQIKVVQQSPSVIVIEPANPQIVYVPQYNPTVIYGTPYVVPGYTAGQVATASVLSFGAGIAIGAMMSSGWGWNSWACNWHGGVVAYGGHPYYGSAAWHGAYGAYGYHGYGAYGAAAYHGAYGSAGAYHGYSANGTYHTGGAYNTAYGAGSSHTSYGADGAIHTGGSGYNKTTGQGYHYGASQTAAGGTVAHGATSTGQHYAGGTTAGGQHYGGSTSSWGHGGGFGHDDGWSSRAASSRGWASRGGGGGRRR